MNQNLLLRLFIKSIVFSMFDVVDLDGHISEELQNEIKRDSQLIYVHKILSNLPRIIRNNVSSRTYRKRLPFPAVSSYQ